MPLHNQWSLAVFVDELESIWRLSRFSVVEIARRMLERLGSSLEHVTTAKPACIPLLLPVVETRSVLSEQTRAFVCRVGYPRSGDALHNTLIVSLVPVVSRSPQFP